MLGRFIKIVMVVFLTMTISFQMSALQDDGMAVSYTHLTLPTSDLV